MDKDKIFSILIAIGIILVLFINMGFLSLLIGDTFINGLLLAVAYFFRIMIIVGVCYFVKAILDYKK